VRALCVPGAARRAGQILLNDRSIPARPPIVVRPTVSWSLPHLE